MTRKPRGWSLRAYTMETTMTGNARTNTKRVLRLVVLPAATFVRQPKPAFGHQWAIPAAEKELTIA